MSYLRKELYELIKSDDTIFDFIQESSLDGIGFWDLENPENEWMNAQFWTTLGYNPEEMPHRADAWQNIINKDDLQLAMSNAAMHIADANNKYDQVVRYIHKNGSTVWMRCRGLAIRNAEGKAIRLLGVHTNVTQEKKKEELLELTNQVAMVGGWEIDIANNKIFWTSVTKHIHEVPDDYEPDFETAANFFEQRESRELINNSVNNAINNGTPYDIELVLTTAKGNHRWTRAKGRCEFANGKCIRLYGTFQDITEQKTQALRLAESEAKYRSIIENAAFGIFLTGPNGSIFDANEIACNMFGYSVDEFRHLGRGSVMDMDDPNMAEFLQTREQYGSAKKELIGKKKNGERFPCEVSSVVFTDAYGNKRTSLALTDISDRKNAEALLRHSEERFRQTFQYSAIGMAIVSTQGKWIDVNDEVCNLLGYSKDELQKIRFEDITHPDDIGIDWQHANELIEGKANSYRIEKRYIHKNGKTIWVLLAVSIVRDNLGTPQYFISQIEDITERKEGEFKINGLLVELNSLLDATTEVSIIGTDLQGLITHFNKGAENLLGYNRQDMIGQQALQIIHTPREIEQRGQELSLKYNQEIAGFDVFVINAKQGNNESRTWTYVRKDGSTFPVQLVVTPIKDQTGIIQGFLGIATDISELNNAKSNLETLSNQLQKRNSQLVNFAHITSHNLRSPVSNLSSLLHLYNTSEDQEDKLLIFSKFEIVIHSLATTLNELVEALKIQEGAGKETELLQFENVFQKTIDSLAGHLLDASAIISHDFSAVPEITYPKDYLESIMLNLISNAIKYRSPQRVPVIHVKTEKRGNDAIFSVTDNGLGIDLKRHGSKLFGLNKTFHKHPEAKGVGLFIVKTQVEAMGGTIFAESEVGKGTTFTIIFNTSKKIYE